MMVSFGALPPCFASSSSWSIKSRGSYAILLPPANADPACDVDALAVCEDVTLGEVECLVDPLPLRPHASPSSSSAVDDDAATLRR